MKHFWDERYSAHDWSYGQLPNAYFKEILDSLASSGSLLLPGEGERRNAIYAAQQGWQVDALDYSEVAQQKALTWAARLGLSLNYQVQELPVFTPPKPQYDLIGLFFLHLLPEHRATLHQQIPILLRKGGKLVLEAFNPRQLGNHSGGPKREDMLFTQAMLSHDFRDLHILQLEERTVTLNEGIFHQGEAQVIRLLAEKKH